MEIKNEPFESLRRDKEHRWRQIRADVDQITDALGKPVDASIKETVVALRALGMNTSGSCEGHMDWAGSAPYIDIDPPQSETLATLEREMFEAQTRAMNADTERISTEEYGRLWDAYHEKRIERKRVVAEEGKKLFPFLEQFYRDRQVSFPRRLILQMPVFNLRLQSQGSDFQDTLSPEERQQKLQDYQAEMQDFTEFLKRKFFEGASASTDFPQRYG